MSVAVGPAVSWITSDSDLEYVQRARKCLSEHLLGQDANCSLLWPCTPNTTKWKAPNKLRVLNDAGIACTGILDTAFGNVANKARATYKEPETKQ